MSASRIAVVWLILLLSAARSSDGREDGGIPSAAVADGHGDGGIPSAEVADGLPGPWISELFYRALANFTVRQVGSSDCRIESDMYDRHLRNHTSWAVRMAESWNRYPIGILSGNNYHMGIYDECVDVRHPVIGQYCMSEIKLLPSTGKDYSFISTKDLDDFGNNNAWKTVLGWGDYPEKVPRNRLNLGICIPNSCSASDLQTSLQNELDTVFVPEEIKAVVRVDPITCTVKGDMYPYNAAYYVTSMIFLMLVLICCGTTLYHFLRIKYMKRSKESVSCDSFYKIFSAIDSTESLLKFDKHSQLNLLHSIKVLMMLMAVLYGHKLFHVLQNPMNNSKFIESIYLNGPDIVLTSSNAIDPFFFISGFLMHLNIIRSFQKAKAGSIFKKITSPIIHRMLRMLPAYCAMMAIVAHIVPHLGDGPLWPQKIWGEAENCKNYWWTNVLFISNFVDTKYGCLAVNYYVSCDVQFFAVGAIIVYIHTKNAKYGIRLLGAVLCLSLVVPFFVTIMTKRYGIDIMYLSYIQNFSTYMLLNKSYRLSYMRATPFLGGLATSFIVEKLKKNKVQFSRLTVYGGTLVVNVICYYAQCYGAKFYIPRRPYYAMEHALYSVVGHCTWPISLMWFFICLFTTGYGLLTYFINNRLFVVLGRLSYCIFLVNITVMMMTQSSLRSPFYLSSKSVTDAWIFETFKCYMMALALYLVVEAPFNKLIKRWI